MALMSLMVAAVSGSASVYGAFWIYASYLSIKGDIKTLAYYLKIIIAINGTGLLVLSLLNPADYDFLFYFGGGKSEVLISGSVLLLIKVGMYIYLKGQIEKNIKTVSTTPTQIRASQKSPNANKEPLDVKVVTTATNTPHKPIADRPDTPQIFAEPTENEAATMDDNDLDYFEQALDEIESDKKHKGIWARAYAESVDDRQAEKLYIKMRAEYLVREARQNEEQLESERLEREERVKSEQEIKSKLEELLPWANKKGYITTNTADGSWIVRKEPLGERKVMDNGQQLVEFLLLIKAKEDEPYVGMVLASDYADHHNISVTCVVYDIANGKIKGKQLNNKWYAKKDY
jgi:hypothetical protein